MMTCLCASRHSRCCGSSTTCCTLRQVTARWLRQSWCRWGVLLLCVATLISLSLPGAPLARCLLSKDSERQRLLSENEQRLQRSELFLERYRANPKQIPKDVFTTDGSPETDVGITVLTMRRGRHMRSKKASAAVYRARYLTQTVVEIMHLLNDSYLTRTYRLHICNIDDRPDLFTEARELEDLLPVFKRYGNEEDPSSEFHTPQPAPSNMWEKLKLDYVYCLKQTLQQGSRYALLVEDDALAHRHVFRVLEHVLHTVVEKPAARPVAYVKLYHPQRLLGYLSLEVERLTELLALALTLGGALTLLLYRRQPPRDVTDSRGGTVMARWAGWGVVVAVMALAVGRTNLLELRRLSVQLYQVTPTPSCCIPAVLYTRRGAQDVASFLQNVTCTAQRSTDIRLDELGQRGGARGLLVQPSLFSHIGLVSSLRTSEVNPLIVQ